jgi:hypothetical protein
MFARIDREGLPCYLETANEKFKAAATLSLMPDRTNTENAQASAGSCDHIVVAYFTRQVWPVPE